MLILTGAAWSALVVPPSPAPAKSGPAGPTKWGTELDALAPEVKPELLLAARIGGPDDQCLTAVQVKGTRIAAAAERNFTVFVTVKDDGTVQTSVTGNPLARQANVRHGLSDRTVLKLGQITYGYKQVDPVLKQPYMTGPGWKLWDWTLDDCKTSKAPYAPLTADSEVVLAAAMPNGHVFASAKCDGGNTSLWCHPKDINTRLKFDIAQGGGGGTSSFAYEISPQGEYVRGMVLRGFLNSVAWDRWGRVLIAGAGVLKSHLNDFGYADGAGVLLADREWKKTLFSTRIGSEDGKASFWACDVDSASGLAAMGGYVEGEKFKEVSPIQKAPGGGKDGLLVILRLWDRQDAKAPASPAKP